MSYHERHLPHWQPEGKYLFVTWRLYGSLPKNVVVKQTEVTPGQAFCDFDRILDQAAFGPLWLKDLRIAALVVNALQFGDSKPKIYELISYVVMANHVHILILPRTELCNITRAIKGFTAREANKLLNRTGQPFWQDESYDRWIRDQDARNRVIRYIERNPVKAGIVTNIEDFRWSSAWEER